MRRALVAALVLAAASARGAPLLAPRPGGPVFVGPTSAHVTSIFWNPAAAGLMQGTHLLVWAAAQLESSSIDRRRIASADGEPDAAGDRGFASSSASSVTPGAFIGLTSDLSSQNVTIAIAVFLPFAEQLPAYDDRAGYHALGGSLYAPTGTLALSYRVSRNFYAGVAASLLFPKLDLEFLRDRALDDCAARPCGVEDPARAQRWTIHSGWDALPGQSFETIGGLNLGGLARFGDWWVGAGIDFLFLGRAGKMADATISEADGTNYQTRARLKYRLPQLVHVGVRRPAFGGFELLVNASYVHAAQHDKVDVRLVSAPAPDVPEWLVRHRGFSDTVAFEAGLEQPPATRVRLGARARIETSAVAADRVAAGQIDSAKAELSGGLELRLSGSVALIAGASISALLPVDSQPSVFQPSAAIDCAASGRDVTTAACIAVREGMAIPTAAGSYWKLGGQLSLGFTYDWW